MAETTIGIKGKFLEYKGRPLVRQGDDIYYGDMSDKYYIYMMIMNEVDELLTAEGLATRIVFIAYVDTMFAPQKITIQNPRRFCLMSNRTLKLMPLGSYT